MAGNALKSVKKFMREGERGLKIDDLLKKKKRSPNGKKRLVVKVDVSRSPQKDEQMPTEDIQQQQPPSLNLKHG